MAIVMRWLLSLPLWWLVIFIFVKWGRLVFWGWLLSLRRLTIQLSGRRLKQMASCVFFMRWFVLWWWLLALVRFITWMSWFMLWWWLLSLTWLIVLLRWLLPWKVSRPTLATGVHEVACALVVVSLPYEVHCVFAGAFLPWKVFHPTLTTGVHVVACALVVASLPYEVHCVAFLL
ncbi:hypothetical protein M0R45_018415 [Rubus argutus]|uniref:Transmembrane protein n=1 Tax=Rubus argutus TaxID=59490 RepID=A0AAW1X444_RUBAR